MNVAKLVISMQKVVQVGNICCVGRNESAYSKQLRRNSDRGGRQWCVVCVRWTCGFASMKGLVFSWQRKVSGQAAGSIVQR